MRKFITLDQSAVIDWGLSYPEAILFSWFYSLPSWANQYIHDGKTYFFASYSKACEDLPALTNKNDTMYRYYKKLESAGLVNVLIHQGKVFVALTEKAKTWNTERQTTNSDKNPTTSDNHPNKLGQPSEEVRTDIRHIDSNTIDSNDRVISPKSPLAEISPNAYRPGEFLNEEFKLSESNPKEVIDSLPLKRSEVNLEYLEKAFGRPLSIYLPNKNVRIILEPVKENWTYQQKENAFKLAKILKHLKVPLLENYYTYLKFHIND